MIYLKLAILLALLFSSIIIIFVKQTKQFKKLINKHVQLKGWGYADIAEEKDWDDYMYFEKARWSRSDWEFTEAVICAVVVCAMLLSGWKLERFLRVYDRHVKQTVETQVEKLSVELKQKLILTLHSELEEMKVNIKSELEDLEDNIRQELSHQRTEMENNGIQDNLTCFKTSQVNYFPMSHQEHHINAGIEMKNSYEPQTNFTSKDLDVETDTEVIRFERNMIGCGAQKSVGECNIKFTNQEIGDDKKPNISYTIVCPLVVEEAAYFEETLDSPCQNKEISEPNIDESAANNEIISSSAVNSLTEEMNKLPENPRQTTKCFVTSIDENVEALPGENNHDNITSNYKNTYDKIASTTQSEGTNNLKCISEGKDVLLEPKEVTTVIKSYNTNRRIPQYQGLKKVSKKQDNIERFGSLTNLSHVKAESMISRSGTPRHQYSSSPRPESADPQVLSANNRRRKQRNTSANAK